MVFSAAQFSGLLEAAGNGCQDTVQAAASYAALNRGYADLIAHQWEKSIDGACRLGASDRALAMLYVANELLQTHRVDACWHRVFSRILPTVFPRVQACARAARAAETESGVIKLARHVWRERDVFSSAFCDGLLERCDLSHSPPAQPPDLAAMLQGVGGNASASSPGSSPAPPEYEPEEGSADSPPPPEYEPNELESADFDASEGGWLGLFSTTDAAGMMALSPQQLAAGTSPAFLTAVPMPGSARMRSSLAAALAEAAAAADASSVAWPLVQEELLAVAMEAKARCDQGLAEAAAAMRARTNRNCHQRLVQAIGGVVDVDEVTRQNEEDEGEVDAAVSALQSACRARWALDLSEWHEAVESVLEPLKAGPPGAGGLGMACLSVPCLRSALRQRVMCHAVEAAQQSAPAGAGLYAQPTGTVDNGHSRLQGREPVGAGPRAVAGGEEGWVAAGSGGIAVSAGWGGRVCEVAHAGRLESSGWQPVSSGAFSAWRPDGASGVNSGGFHAGMDRDSDASFKALLGDGLHAGLSSGMSAFARTDGVGGFNAGGAGGSGVGQYGNDRLLEMFTSALLQQQQATAPYHRQQQAAAAGVPAVTHPLHPRDHPQHYPPYATMPPPPSHSTHPPQGRVPAPMAPLQRGFGSWGGQQLGLGDLHFESQAVQSQPLARPSHSLAPLPVYDTPSALTHMAPRQQRYQHPRWGQWATRNGRPQSDEVALRRQTSREIRKKRHEEKEAGCRSQASATVQPAPKKIEEGDARAPGLHQGGGCAKAEATDAVASKHGDTTDTGAKQTVNTSDSAVTKVDEDEADVILERQQLSLLCPLSCRRILVPVKGRDCAHMQCFDEDTWFAFVRGGGGKAKPTADQSQSKFCVDLSAATQARKCPLCSKDITALVQDTHFAALLRKCSPGMDAVQVDANWNMLPWVDLNTKDAKDGKRRDAIAGLAGRGHDSLTSSTEPIVLPSSPEREPEQGAHARGSASTAAPAGASPGVSRRRPRAHDATGRTLKAPRGSAGDDDAVVIVID